MSTLYYLGYLSPAEVPAQHSLIPNRDTSPGEPSWLHVLEVHSCFVHEGELGRDQPAGTVYSAYVRPASPAEVRTLPASPIPDATTARHNPPAADVR